MQRTNVKKVRQNKATGIIITTISNGTAKVTVESPYDEVNIYQNPVKKWQ